MEKISQSELLKLLITPKFSGKLQPESFLQKQFVDYLKFLSIEKKLKCVWFSVANENANNKNPIFGSKLKSLGKINGTPDMIFLWEGGSGCIEFKSQKGKLTESQKLFQKWCESLNVNYEIVKNFEDAVFVLKKWKIL